MPEQKAEAGFFLYTAMAGNTIFIDDGFYFGVEVNGVSAGAECKNQHGSDERCYDPKPLSFMEIPHGKRLMIVKYYK